MFLVILPDAGAISTSAEFLYNDFHLSKQNSPRWDATFCGILSGAILFALVSHKKDMRLKELTHHFCFCFFMVSCPAKLRLNMSYMTENI